MKKIIFILGTRPEGIKCAPVIKEFSNGDFETRVINTGQHKEILDDVLNFFSIKSDYNLNIMLPNQKLEDMLVRLMIKIPEILRKEKPDLVFVQGDTISAFAGALSAYFSKIKIGHIEAGLRSWDKYQPFPEEFNRCAISCISDYNFTPTEIASKNLENSGVKNIHMVGNTVIDAVKMADTMLNDEKFVEKYGDMKDFVLVTTHRRENFDKLEYIVDGIRKIIDAGWKIIYSVHPNPNVKKFIYEAFSCNNSVKLYDSISYPEFLWLMKRSRIIVSDSGGIQEEAACFNKPVVILRNVTEREESVKLGYSKLAGTDPDSIFACFNELLNINCENWVNPYGDGLASKRIRGIIGA